MAREELFNIARDIISHGKAGTMAHADDIMKLPASVYYDEDLYNLEMERIIRRIPLILGPSCELAKPGDFKTMRVLDVEVLLTRAKDGIAHAFTNSCTHRGAKIMREECGKQSRFTCPYHGWTYSNDGRLLAITAPEDFGDIDKSEHGLVELPLYESAGMIWVILTPGSTLDMKAFLAGYDDMLDAFGFKNWKYVSKRTFKGPNWKLAYDGYLEYYHIPVLHGPTFGTDSTNQGMYYAWGPHQHIKSPDQTKGHAATEVLGYLADLSDKPEEDWDMETLTYGVWTVFPTTSIASFAGGGRGVMVSQILPGETVDESITTQFYIMEEMPEDIDAANAQFDFFQEVVMREDYAAGYSAQQSLKRSGLEHLMLGRNELGNQRFHTWAKMVVEAESDEDLAALFDNAERGVGIPNKMAAE